MRALDALSHAQAQVADVTHTMVTAVSAATVGTEKAKDLEDRTAALAASASVMDSGANELRRQMRQRNIKVS